MRNPMRLLPVLLIAALSLTACGGSTPADPPAPTPGQTDSKAAVPAKVEGKLTLYTSQPEADANKLIEGFKAKHPGTDVVLFRSGTEKVISKLLTEAEAGAVEADLLLVADAPTFEILKSKQLLEAYTSPEAAPIDKQFADPDGMYIGTKVMATGIIYNTKAAAPKGFLDLVKPEAKGQVIMPSPLYSGAAAFNLGVFTRTDSVGWKFYEDLKAGQVTIVQGNGDVVKRVASGEKQYGIVVDYLALNAKKAGSPVDFIFPADGLPVITEPIALVKGSKNPTAAKAFIDFVLSEEGQKLATSMGYNPVRPGVKAPDGFPELSKIKVLNVSAKVLNENRDGDKQKFGSLFGQ